MIILKKINKKNIENIEMPMVVVYDNKIQDYPNMYVAKIWSGKTGTSNKMLLIDQNLDELRKKIFQDNLKWSLCKRSKFDDPVILETWMLK